MQHLRSRCRGAWKAVLTAGLCIGLATEAAGQELQISELLAVNSSVAFDTDGDASDLIELHNPTAEAVDLGGWSLTDDPEEPRKWQLPEAGGGAPQIAPGGYLVVFASGKDRTQGHELHTTFRLRAAGEYLALIRPDGTVAYHYAPEYPEQFADVSYGIESASGELRYFLEPTPGAPNGPGVRGFVEDTKFSVDRGFYDEPFEVELTSATPDARIVYTLDGSEPVDVTVQLPPDIVLLDGDSPARVLVPTDGSLGSDWVAPDFDDSGWRAGAAGMGFEQLTGYEDLIRTDVVEELFEKGGSAYLRVEFTVDEPIRDVLVLGMRYDDGFVAYLNGELLVSQHAPEEPAWDSVATRLHSDSLAREIEEYAFERPAALRPGRNVLAIHGLNRRLSDRDFLIVPRLELPGVWPRPRTSGESFPYEGPIPITTTTHLRAAAFLDGLGPTDVDTQTYLFLDDVLRQDGAGLPESWDGHTADYAMDPDVVDDPAYRDTIREDMKSIPVISLVLNEEDLYSPEFGIYTFPEERGVEWERPCSMEYFDPHSDDREIQVNCGLRMYGFFSRGHGANLKHSFRLLFKRQYGPTRLEFPLFPDWDIERFNTVILGAQGDRQWTTQEASERRQSQYLRGAWARHTAKAMGKETSSITWVHLYLNGLYWGLYQPRERPDAAFMEDHFGGEAEDYDAINARTGTLEVTNGSLERWDGVMRLARGGLSSEAAYEEIQRHIDVPDLIGYMLINFYGGNHDWTGTNGNNMRVAGAPDLDAPFRQFCWDMEITMLDEDDNVVRVDRSFDTPAAVHALLASNDEYRVLFGDQAHRHLTSGGVLSPESAAARWQQLAKRIEGAVVGESARWGDTRRSTPYTRDAEWRTETNRLLGEYFPERSRILLDQLRRARLYPAIEAPVFSRPGGSVPLDFRLFLLASEGTILYTLDGTDPRAPGGAVAPGALTYTAPPLETRLLVDAGAAVRVLVPVDDQLASGWVVPDFDDSSWRVGATGVGFETATGFEEHILTDVREQAHDVNASVYLRIEFTLDDPSAIDVLTLGMRYDDGYAAYLNGELVARKNAPPNLSWDSRALRSRGDSSALEFERVHLTAGLDLLRAGRNVLALHGLNRSPRDGDLLFVPRLEAGSFAGPPLPAALETLVRTRVLVGDEWSALSEATFVPVDSAAAGLQRPGDLTQDGRVNLVDAVRLLSLVLGSAPVALPCEGDVESDGNLAVLDANGDGGVNLADAVHLLNYQLRRGAPPASGNQCLRVVGCADSACR